jgi:hypothetical protein
MFKSSINHPNIFLIMKFSAIFTAIAATASVQAQYYSSALRRTSDGSWGRLQSGYCINMGYDYFYEVNTDNGYYTYIWLYNQQCSGSAQYKVPRGYYRFREVLQIGSAASLNY